VVVGVLVLVRNITFKPQQQLSYYDGDGVDGDDRDGYDDG